MYSDVAQLRQITDIVMHACEVKWGQDELTATQRDWVSLHKGVKLLIRVGHSLDKHHRQYGITEDKGSILMVPASW